MSDGFGMSEFEVEWWYADGHGFRRVRAVDAEHAVARFWKQFGEFLPMAYKRAVARRIA